MTILYSPRNPQTIANQTPLRDRWVLRDDFVAGPYRDQGAARSYVAGAGTTPYKFVWNTNADATLSGAAESNVTGVERLLTSMCVGEGL